MPVRLTIKGPPATTIHKGTVIAIEYRQYTHSGAPFIERIHLKTTRSVTFPVEGEAELEAEDSVPIEIRRITRMISRRG